MAPVLEAVAVSKSFRIPSVARNTVRQHALAFFRPRQFRQLHVLDKVSLALKPGESLGLMGRNGSGKSTLLATLDSSLSPTSGRVAVTGPAARAPQDPGALLSGSDIATQLAAHEATHGLPSGVASRLLTRLAPDLQGDRLEHAPADLSEGQRMCVALSLVLARETPVVLLDEPTRGLDYAAKDRLAALLGERAAAGCTVVVATHDVELAAELATRVVVLAEGEVVADEVVVMAEGEIVSSGTPQRVLAESPSFAPQVTKVLGPPWLVVEEVAAALARGVAR